MKKLFLFHALTLIICLALAPMTAAAADRVITVSADPAGCSYTVHWIDAKGGYHDNSSAITQPASVTGFVTGQVHVTVMAGYEIMSLSVVNAATSAVIAHNLSNTVENLITFPMPNDAGVNVMITFKGPPVLTEQPSDVQADEGGEAAFSVTAEGAAPLACQWYSVSKLATGKEGKPAALKDTLGKAPAGALKITGSSTERLTITGLTATLNNTHYYCAVTNSAGSVNSKSAALSVRAKGIPQMDAPVIVTHPHDATVMEGEPISFTVVATGDGTLHYEWSMVDAGVPTVFSNDTPTFALTESANHGIHNGYDIWVKVISEYGEAISDKARIRVNAKDSLRITSHPEDASAASGKPVSFTVDAAGGAQPLTYKWYGYSGMAGAVVAMTNAMDKTLAILANPSENGSFYYCVVTDADGNAAQSGYAYLEVTSASTQVFTDVSPDDWFYSDVMNAAALGLVNGATPTTYAPDSSLTIAEAIKLAACMHQKYRTGQVTLQSGAKNWYDSYVAYAEENNIIKAGEYAGKYGQYATRAQYVMIFYPALPSTDYVDANPVADGAIPDVKLSDSYGGVVYAFYRAGILAGTDAKGAFAPASNIKRSEVAAILSRMMDHSSRKFIALPNPPLEGLPTPACWTTATGYVLFTTREGKSAVDYGTWANGAAHYSRGAGYVRRTSVSGQIVTIELYFPPVPSANAADAQDMLPIYDAIEVDTANLDNDGKVKMRAHGGAWEIHYNAGLTWQDGYDNVHP
jgi:hypothetical protein